jgi:C1A family cysteine protease
MKKIVLLAVITCLLKVSICVGQNQKAFEMAYPTNKNLSVSNNYNESTTIYPFKTDESIYSLSVGASVQLNTAKSYVRVILTTESGEEYLVLESNDMITEQNQIDFSDYGEETAMLNGVVPASIRIEIEDASVTMETISYNNISQNKLTSSDFTLASKEIKKNQDAVKIDRINRQIKKKGLLWQAGETSVSLMTYQEKKKLLGDTLPNLRGFEYYKGGIFDLADASGTSDGLNSSEKVTSSSLVSAFDWRNRHGQNWMTAVRDQGAEGSCWAHGTLASMESVINLYYNQHINQDLSEQAFVSCMYTIYRSVDLPGLPSPPPLSQCGSMNVPTAILCQVKNLGAVDESCYPYSNVGDSWGLDANGQVCTTLPPNGCTLCGNLCSDYMQRLWKITDFKELAPDGATNGNPWSQVINEDSLKVNIIKYGPSAFTYMHWGHVMCFAGFGIIKQGDVIYADSSTYSSVTVPAYSPLIGKTYWIAKNSWGSGWGENGYCKLSLNLNDIITGVIKTPIIQPVTKNYTVTCTDADGDGYCFWGIGPRPSTGCPVTSHIEEDGDDSNPFFGPYDANYNLTAICPSGYTTISIPTVTATQPTCSVPTGSVVVSGLPSSGTWKLTRNDGVVTTGTGTSTTISGLLAGTYQWVVSNTTQCASAPTTAKTINSPSLSAPVVGTITQPSCNLATGSVVLSALPSSGTWTLTRSDGTTTTGTGTSKTLSGIPAGTYTYTVKNSSNCVSLSSGPVIINTQPVVSEPHFASVTPPTCTLATGAFEIDCLPASGNWTLTRNDGVTTTGSGTGTLLKGIPPGNYTYTVTNSTGCVSPPSKSYTMPAQPVTPTAPIVGAITQPSGSVTTGSVVLSGLPSTGTWTITRSNDGVTSTGTGTSTTLTGIPAGAYTFIVTNDAGCTSEPSLKVVIQASTTVTIGTGTSTQRQPFGMYYGYERSAAIYTSAEIGGTGSISSLAFKVATAKTSSASVKIYIKTTTATTLTAGTWASQISGATTVYTGTLSFSATGWKTISLSTPFNYTGNNLLVLVETNYGGTGTTSYPYFYYTTSTSKHECWYQDSSAPTVNGTVNSNRPNIQITYSSTACTPPTAPLVGTITQPSCALSTGIVVLSGLPPMGVYTLTRNPGGVTTSGTGTSFTVSGIPAGTYTFTVTNAAGCTSFASANVVINAQPTISAPIVGTITQPTAAIPTGSVALSGLPTSVTWTLTRNPGAVTTTGSGTSTTVSGLAPGTYTFTVTNIAGCVSPASSNVVINAVPTTTTVTIGSGTSYQRQPFGMYYGYERSAAIYTSAEIGNTGIISSLAFKVATAKTSSASVKIYIKTTTATTITAGTWASQISGATTVYTGTLSFSATGWKTITLSTPFNYTGNNLLVLIETNYGGTGTSSYPYFYYTSATSKHEYWCQDNSAPTGSGTVNSYRPNIQITFSTGSKTQEEAESTIEYNENNTIKVYPNPVSNELTIEIEGNTNNTSFEILNSIGQLVLAGNMTDKTVIQTANLSSGIYLMKIEILPDLPSGEAGEKTYVFKKIIKE